MPRVSAPLVLLPAWLVMVACSPHSLRIGKYSLALDDSLMVTLSVHRGDAYTSSAPWDASLASLSVAVTDVELVEAEAEVDVNVEVVKGPC